MINFYDSGRFKPKMVINDIDSEWVESTQDADNLALEEALNFVANRDELFWDFSSEE